MANPYFEGPEYKNSFPETPELVLLSNRDDHRDLVVTYRDKPEVVVEPGDSLNVQSTDGLTGFFHKPKRS